MWTLHHEGYPVFEDFRWRCQHLMVPNSHVQQLLFILSSGELRIVSQKKMVTRCWTYAAHLSVDMDSPVLQEYPVSSANTEMARKFSLPKCPQYGGKLVHRFIIMSYLALPIHYQMSYRNPTA